MRLRIEAPCANCSAPVPPEAARCPECGAWRAPPAPRPFLRRRGAVPALIALGVGLLSGLLGGLLGGVSDGALGVVGIAGALWCLHVAARGEAAGGKAADAVRRVAWAAVAASLAGALAGGAAGYRYWLRPTLARAQQRETAQSVANTLRILTAAEMDYASLHPGAGFSPRLSDLRARGNMLGLGQPLHVRGNAFRHFGYAYFYAPAGPGAYRIVARPLPPAAGRPCYLMDEKGILTSGACAAPRFRLLAGQARLRQSQRKDGGG